MRIFLTIIFVLICIALVVLVLAQQGKDAGLGTINYVLLTVNYMKSKNLKINGLIFNHYHPGNVMEEDNIFMCEHLTGIKTVAKVKDGDDSIEITKEKLISLFE